MPHFTRSISRLAAFGIPLATVPALAACVSMDPNAGPPRKESVCAVSPHTGLRSTVGALGMGAVDDAAIGRVADGQALTGLAIEP